MSLCGNAPGTGLLPESMVFRRVPEVLVDLAETYTLSVTLIMRAELKLTCMPSPWLNALYHE